MRPRPKGDVGHCYGNGPLRRAIVTVVPAGTIVPAAGDWWNTQECGPLTPVNLGTRPAALIV